jgi:F-type H+-transporting ATPase subunit delta
MKISKQARREAKELFRSCQVGGLLNEDRVRMAVQQVIAKKPRGYLAILSQLLRLVKLDQERRTAKVESVAPLTADLQSGIRSNLTRLYGPGLNLSFGQNPALLGGLRIQIGSDVYDGSVQGRLSRLQESF